MTITSEGVQKYARIILYNVAMFLVAHGWSKADPSTVESVVGFGVMVVNFAWTIYGDSIISKLNEIAKYKVVTKVVVTDPAVVAATSAKIVNP